MRVPLGMSKLQPEPEQKQPAEASSPADTTAAPSTGPQQELSGDDLKARVIEVLKTCYDPEIPVNIWELGLVYALEVSSAGEVQVQMTLTSPACPVAGSLPGEIQRRISQLPGVKNAKVELVWDPPWTMERMSEAARIQLGFY